MCNLVVGKSCLIPFNMNQLCDGSDFFSFLHLLWHYHIFPDRLLPTYSLKKQFCKLLFPAASQRDDELSF